MGLLGCPETSVGIYRSTMRKIPKEPDMKLIRPQLFRKFPALYGTQNLLWC